MDNQSFTKYFSWNECADVINHTLQYVNSYDLLKARQVSKEWYKLATSILLNTHKETEVCKIFKLDKFIRILSKGEINNINCMTKIIHITHAKSFSISPLGSLIINPNEICRDSFKSPHKCAFKFSKDVSVQEKDKFKDFSPRYSNSFICEGNNLRYRLFDFNGVKRKLSFDIMNSKYTLTDPEANKCLLVFNSNAIPKEKMISKNIFVYGNENRVHVLDLISGKELKTITFNNSVLFHECFVSESDVHFLTLDNGQDWSYKRISYTTPNFEYGKIYEKKLANLMFDLNEVSNRYPDFLMLWENTLFCKVGSEGIAVFAIRFPIHDHSKEIIIEEINVSKLGNLNKINEYKDIITMSFSEKENIEHKVYQIDFRKKFSGKNEIKLDRFD